MVLGFCFFLQLTGMGTGCSRNNFGRNGNHFSGLITGTRTRPPNSRKRNRNRNPEARISQSGGPEIGPSPGQLLSNLLVPGPAHFLLVQGFGFRVLDQRDLFTIGITKVDICFLGAVSSLTTIPTTPKYDGN